MQGYLNSTRAAQARKVREQLEAAAQPLEGFAPAGNSEANKKALQDSLKLAQRYLVTLDPIAAKQQEITNHLKAMESGVLAATATGTPGLDKMREAVAKLAAQFQAVRTEADKFAISTAQQVYTSGLASGAKAYDATYMEAAKAVTANQGNRLNGSGIPL